MTSKKLVIRLSGYISLFIFILIILGACKLQNKENNSDHTNSYYQSVDEWKENRIKRLKGHNGWLNLAGLFWLNDGINTVGSHADNDIIFPAESPEFLGSFNLMNEKIEFISKPDVNVLYNGKAIRKIELNPDVSSSPTILTYDSLAWFIIKREGKFGIRLRDYNKPEIKKLDSIPCFKTDLNWKVEASLIPTPSKVSIAIPNVLGQVNYEEVPGILEFVLDKQTLKLYPLGKPGNLWLVFGDETSGAETYGGGRFLGIEGPDKNGKYTIDFNKAYNPPCAFTPFATCPLPPKENILEIPVTAGEKNIPHTWH